MAEAPALAEAEKDKRQPTADVTKTPARGEGALRDRIRLDESDSTRLVLPRGERPVVLVVLDPKVEQFRHGPAGRLHGTACAQLGRQSLGIALTAADGLADLRRPPLLVSAGEDAHLPDAGSLETDRCHAGQRIPVGMW